ERVAVFYKAAFYDRSAFFRTVNAGHGLASESVYSDDPAKLPDAWGQLTDGEKLDYRTELESRLRDRMDALQYYSDESLAAEQQERINRIRALLALVG
ncbi:hypothetical protein ACFPPE_18090, partial [Agromyces tardus]|uniref:hypothetical protein n=1 Tax=Agromyces tardus TaxID=2583849 RepID=UPI003614F9D3